MGTFTSQAAIVEQCVKGGIPVWYIRPATKFNTRIRVLRYVQLFRPEDAGVELQDSTPLYPTIYAGKNSDIDMQAAISNDEPSCHEKDPFSIPIASDRPSRTVRAQDSTLRQRHAKYKIEDKGYKRRKEFAARK